MREYNDYALTVRRWLRSYHQFHVTIENLGDDIETLEKLNRLDVAAPISKYGDTPRGGTPELNSVESAAARHIARAGQIDEKRRSIETISLTLRKLDRAISCLPEIERRLAVGHFTEGLSWEELGNEFGYTEKWARTHGGQAIRQLAAMLFGDRAQGGKKPHAFVFAV